MKGLRDLKKLWLLFLSLSTAVVAESDLDNYLSNRKNLLFEYEDKINYLESGILKRSWINPLMINYNYTNSNQPLLDNLKNETLSFSLNQPIFKSGGIIYAMEYADITKIAKSLGVYKQKRALIVQLLDTLYDLKKIKLQKKQLKLIIKNDNIDIQRKKEQYLAGVIDSSFLDQAIIKRNQDKTKLLALELDEQRVRSSFESLSDKNPDRLKPPKLKIIDKRSYLKNHIDLKLDSLDISLKDYNSKITLSKYLPSVSIQANYYKTHSNIPTPGYRDDYRTLGVGVSMPININSPADIEKSKLAYLKSMVQLQDDIKRVESEYKLIIKAIKLIDKKIALAKSDEKLYKRLLKYTKEQFVAGNKTKLDIKTIQNSLNIAKLDRLIYQVERQKQILKLYQKSSR